MNRNSGQEALALAAIAASVVLHGCTLLLDHEKQCVKNEDCKRFSSSAMCVSGTCQPDPEKEEDDSAWGCLGKISRPSFEASQVNVELPFFDLLTKAPVTNLLVRPCAKMDVTCANPLAAAVAPDDVGVAKLTVNAGFDGYVEIIPGADESGGPPMAPSLFFMNPPPMEDTRYGVITLFSGAVIENLARSQGNTIDPTLGHLFSAALDCQGVPSAGVSWEPDRTAPATRRFYYVDGLPSEAAAATDATGYGGFINLPTVTVRLYAKLQATGQSIGTASVFLRAGHISFVFLTPTP